MKTEIISFLHHLKDQVDGAHFEQVNGALWEFYEFLMDDAQSDERCDYHNVPLPLQEEAGGHRICRDFRPNQEYDKANPTKQPTVEERFAWFKIPLHPGTLYVFPYNNPPGIRVLTRMSDKP